MKHRAMIFAGDREMMKRTVYDFYSHQPYLEYNRQYQNYRPAKNDYINGIIWEAYEAPQFDAGLDIAFPDICADIMMLYTDDKAYCYFMGGTEGARSMRDLDFIDDVRAIYGFKFVPGSIGNIFTEELCDAAGSMIAAEDIMFGGKAIVDELISTDDFDKKLEVMRRYIVQRISDGYEKDALADYVAGRIMRSHGTAKINDIADETGYSDRYLRKAISNKLGMSAKTFSQVAKMQWSYHLGKELHNLSGAYSLADLAMESGYFDQSHMNASYKRLTGMLPNDAFELYTSAMTLQNNTSKLQHICQCNNL